MDEWTEKAVSAIEAQQAKAERFSTVWMVGEQLKDMLRAEPRLAELVAQDLENAAMSIAACEKKIKALADERHKTVKGNGAGVSPMEAEESIRKFYGLPEQGTAAPEGGGEAGSREGVIDIADFF